MKHVDDTLNAIVKLSDGRFKAFCLNSKAANILNHRFRTYSNVDFEAEGSEGIFYFTKDEYQFVRTVLSKFGGL